MTDKEKLERIKKLADEMYYRMQNLATDTSGIRKAMYDYHQFIIYEYYKEEPVSIWHNMDEIPIKGKVIVVQTKDTFYGLSVQKGGSTYKNRNKDRYIKWAYASDLLNLSNVQRDVKNLKCPISNDSKETLKDYAYQVAYDLSHDWLKENATWDDVETAVKLSAQWQKEHLWKDAQGDDLPEIDREVIVLYQRYPLENSEYAVSFAHRPKEYWDGKSIATGEVTRYYPARHDKGGWNIPNIKFWLDCELPKIEE